MHRPPSIPFSIIRELRCTNCLNVVSCGPVHVVPDESILCGRCQYLAKNIYRNTSFEALASMFVYPCQHWEDHCPKILQWNESFVHEDGCSYSSGCSLFWKHPKAFLKGKREMPIGDIRLIPVPEKLLDQIKCVQCESYLSCEPVYILPDGKNICHRCIPSNGIPADSVRNVAYEILSNIIIFPCVFRNRGCPTRLKFGTDLWHHEAECSYNQMYKIPEKKPYQKGKGVIKTHSGHYWGTITPYSAPFAPPTPSTDFDINKELVKSLKRQQERKFLKAEEINSNITKANSEDDSRDGSRDGSGDASRDASASSEADDSEKANSYDKSLYNSEPSTPSSLRFDGHEYQQTPQYNNIKQNNNYYENIYYANKNQESNSARNSRDNSFSNYTLAPTPIKGLNEENYENLKRISRNNSYIQNSYEPLMYRSSAGTKIPLQDLDYNILAGHYPVFTNPYGQGLIPKPSFRQVSRTDSIASNKELMNELRLKQNKLKNKNMERKEGDPSPYKECNNLEDILQVHNKISE